MKSGWVIHVNLTTTGRKNLAFRCNGKIDIGLKKHNPCYRCLDRTARIIPAEILRCIQDDEWDEIGLGHSCHSDDCKSEESRLAYQ